MIFLNNINKTIKKKHILSNVCMNIDNGEICALLGLNGAGKSTLMKVICNLCKQDSGVVYIDNVEKLDNKNGGFMINAPAFYNELSLIENLYLFSKLYDNVTLPVIKDTLELLGLSSQSTKKYKYLSTGMKQRMYFAFAIMCNPKLLILDEPFSGIDPLSIVLFKNIIKQMASNGCCILVSGHDIRELESFCTSVYILDKGKIVYENKDLTSIENLEQLFINNVSSSGDAQ